MSSSKKQYLVGAGAIVVPLVIWWVIAVGLPTATKWRYALNLISQQVGTVDREDPVTKQKVVVPVYVADVNAVQAQERMLEMEKRSQQQPQAPAPPAGGAPPQPGGGGL
jgi:hypothetical protein